VRDRRVVITGVGRGLGRRLAEALVEAGDEVWGTSRNGDAPEGLRGRVTMELRSEVSIAAGSAEIASQTDGIDLLINCAGTDARSFGAPPGERGPFDLDAETFNAVMEVNATGPMLVTKYMLALLRAGRDAMVINVSSQLGSMALAQTMGADTVYNVSKAALNMLSLKTAAAVRDDGIGVVMIHPGWVRTDMGGPSAALTIDESAHAIVDTIGSLSIEDSGRFIRWDGTDHPW
jgi:NAD(P)-dependent dehydrogenase (short-subunit alcohol dehydrogenase family)